MRTTATAQVSSPLVERETRAAATSMRLRASLVEHGVSHEALPVAVLRDLLGPVLEARGLAITELPTAMDATSAKAAAQFVRESGSAAADLMEAHADGVLSPSEAATVIESLDEAIAAGLAVRAFARRALTVPVRRIGRAG